MTKYKNYNLNIVKDYPIQGINFIDINGLLANTESYQKVINEFVKFIEMSNCIKQDIAIIAPESRGFLLASAVAYKIGLPLVAIRKKGKVANNPYRFKINNEYDSYDMEIDNDILNRFEKYIYIDDILATGQTLSCIANALEKKGKTISLALHLTTVENLKDIRLANPVLQKIPNKEVI